MARVASSTLPQVNSSTRVRPFTFLRFSRCSTLTGHAPDTGDDHLINEATFTQLHRIKRDELIRLSRVAGLLDDNEDTALKKGELADALILAVRTSKT